MENDDRGFVEDVVAHHVAAMRAEILERSPDGNWIDNVDVPLTFAEAWLAVEPRAAKAFKAALVTQDNNFADPRCQRQPPTRPGRRRGDAEGGIRTVRRARRGRWHRLSRRDHRLESRHHQRSRLWPHRPRRLGAAPDDRHRRNPGQPRL